MKNKKVARAGSLLMLESGEYSDYQCDGFCVVLKDFEPLVELELFLEANPDMRDRYCFEKDKFVGYLISKGYLMVVDYGRMYLGSYGAEDIEFWPFSE